MGQISADAQGLFDRLPRSGRISMSKAGGLTGWDYDRVAKAKEELKNVGLITIGRGWGGPFGRVSPRLRPDVGPPPILASEERELYAPLADWIFAEFLPIDFEFERDLFEVSIVADRRPLRARKWEVPDILAVSLKRYPYVPGVQMEVISFEVKRKANAFDLHSIFEAVSHSKFAHRTYYCFEWTDITFRHIPEYQRLAQEAQVRGIGLIRAWFDDDRKRSIIPEIVLDARPVFPEPAVLNSVIDDLCPKETKAKMLEYLSRAQ